MQKHNLVVKLHSERSWQQSQQIVSKYAQKLSRNTWWLVVLDKILNIPTGKAFHLQLRKKTMLGTKTVVPWALQIKRCEKSSSQHGVCHNHLNHQGTSSQTMWKTVGPG